ncbi:MAG: sigma 54-interacting transcriptional regulator [Sandaracinus sp.]|nr:sigma 54-interacting transcriptional regulator [Sandaracinus sp.]
MSRRWALRVGDRAIVVDQVVFVGRDPECHVRLEGVRASRRHCAIRVEADRLFVRDLGSRNGTFVNGERIHEAELSIGDRIEVGDAELAVAVAHAEPPSVPPSFERVVVRDGRERYSLASSPRRDTEWSHADGHAPVFARFDALYRGVVAAARAESARDLLEDLGDTLVGLFDCDAVGLWMPLESTGELEAVAWLGVSEAESGCAFRARRAYARQVCVAEPPTATSPHAFLSATLKGPEGRLGAVALRARITAKPPTREDLELLIACCNQAALGILAVRERVRLRADAERFAATEGGRTLVGDSAVMTRLRELVAKVAPAQAPVLVRGESGSGKELVARAIHDQSPRASGPFVAINCGAIPETLVESTLFGHEKGAFTNAHRRQLGVFERADGGTLFLDEVGELAPELQVRLLRVLETGEVLRVGAEEPVRVRVRVVAATHRDLEAMVDEGLFREDLFYRLDVVTLDVPPLRDRLEDLPALCAHLLHGLRDARRVDGVSEAALERLRQHAWPGNVRELRNVLERAVLLGSARTIEAGDIVGLRRRSHAPPSSPSPSLADAEAEHVRRVLESVGWNKTKAAELLGIERPTIYAKIKKYGLEPPE